ncbi:NAD(P)(+)--arginine ADP-ribosyltransferase 2-like isoform X2 [Motacilla alba alba]|uniref:NAD(P)(+)--arginine ADP-ribosyltransferase 2-like isoform X2 n=1 Tax=Motacilla alba alba TaxID=1094192 RepID=UPI0018D523BB|nr:NAD(P)(+)--arginine ADP-ribosyltransferase 2-like isoform X2 [Motacilla alba alba]
MAKFPVSCRTRRDPLVPPWSLWPLPAMAPLAQTLALLAMAVATTAAEAVTLDMAQDSFDDQYRDCGPAMKAALPTLNISEFQQNKKFAEVWVKAAAEWQRRRPPVSPLSPDQATALMAYTMDDLYKEFNEAVRAAGCSRQEYRDNFHFKTLHFLLTQAVGRLKNTRGSECHFVYRGVHGVRFKAERGDIVRFGQFTSASQSATAAKQFGTDALFLVETCQGAEIRNFSYYPHEKEVLIPPFETFEVVNVSQEGDKARIQLHSRGTFSKYNCEWLQGGSIPRASFHLGGLLLATTALAVATGSL